jgi:hypothetical protein
MSSAELKEVDFSVIKEDYSRFVLDDGTLIKAKIVIRKIFTSIQNTPEGYPIQTGFDFIHIAVAKVTENLKRDPTPQPVISQNEVGEEIRSIKEEILEQQYDTENGFRITIKPVLTKAFRYNKYDMFGDPMYSVSLQQIINIDKL